jgi:hypothetical protein
LAAPAANTQPFTLTIIARQQDGSVVGPRTKKNSPQVIPNAKRADGSPFVVLAPSEAYREWHRAAIHELMNKGLVTKTVEKRIVRGKEKRITTYAYRPGCHWPIDYPVNCRALFYRQALVGDANGYYQAVADFLQDIGVLVNDKWIVQWDGSRLLKDKDNPRIEVELTRIGAPAPAAVGPSDRFGSAA